MLHVEQVGKKSSKIRIVWLHGWGNSHKELLPLASFFSDPAENYLVDLPGFGKSTKPKDAWGTEDYAKDVLKWLDKLPKKKTYIVGHSLGGRIAIRMASAEPEKIAGIVLIASAGLRMHKSFKLKIKVLISKIGSPVYKKVERFVPEKLRKILLKIMGSEDYNTSSGVMKEIARKVINENLADIAKNVKTKTLLIYGSQDTSTPPAMGRKFSKLMKNSKFVELKGYNHNSILMGGVYQVRSLIHLFLKEQ